MHAHLSGVLTQPCARACSLDGGTPNKQLLTIAIFLVCVIFLQAIFQFFQNFQSSRMLESFSKTLPTQAVVVRDGTRMLVQTSDLVVGDIVKVRPARLARPHPGAPAPPAHFPRPSPSSSLANVANGVRGMQVVGGDASPADLRVLETSGLKVDKSSLTGENEPINTVAELPREALKSPASAEDIRDETNEYMHANNLVLLGTRVLEGEATCVVVNVGDRCAMADLIRLSSQGGDLNTTLHEEINYVVNIFLVFCVILIALFYITYYGHIKDTYPGACLLRGRVPSLIESAARRLPDQRTRSRKRAGELATVAPSAGGQD
jgi:sodium/potassium-transporting ATPase subunit alpha